MAPARKPASMRFFRHTGPEAARVLAFQPYDFEFMASNICRRADK